MVFGEAPEPSPAQGDVRVAVHAVGLNPVDYKIARMGHPDWWFPHILGLALAVDDLGAPRQPQGDHRAGWQRRLGTGETAARRDSDPRIGAGTPVEADAGEGEVPIGGGDR